MINAFPVEYELNNGTRVLVKETDDPAYEFHLTRLNGMKHNFSWSEAEGITDSETATGLPRESFAEEESEAVAFFQQLKNSLDN